MKGIVKTVYPVVFLVFLNKISIGSTICAVGEDTVNDN